MIVTKEEALSILKLKDPSECTDPSPQDIQKRYQKLALKWHPSKHHADRRSIRKFDMLCRSYIVLTEGRDSIDKCLTSREMLNVFIKAFELEDLGFNLDVAAQDECRRPLVAFADECTGCRGQPSAHGCTQCNKPPSAASRCNEPELLATSALTPAEIRELLHLAAWASSPAFTLFEEPLAASTSTEWKKPLSTEHHVLPGVGTSAKECVSTASVGTSAAPVKLLVTEEPKQNEATVVPAPSAEQLPDKKTKKKASRKTAKRRKQREKAEAKKSSAKSSSSEEMSTEDEKKKVADEGLDPNSAFVSMALSRKTKGANSASGGVIPKVSKKSGKDVIVRSRRLAREGCDKCNVGRHKEAVDLFTQAIKLYPQDQSYFGNRSYCYSILGDYDKALKDAEKAISLQPQQAKGYFRRANAQLGLQKYSEAAESFRKVLEIDPDCHEAKSELHSVCVFEVMSMGFTLEEAEWSVTKGNNDVQEAINLLFGPDAVKPDMKLNPVNLEGSQSLWVGNIKPEVTEKMLMSLFRRFGDVHSIRILHDRHCAFINYGNKVSPGRAMDALQGHLLCGKAILIRFPDHNFMDKPPRSPRSGGEDQALAAAGATAMPKAKPPGPLKNNECYFWRTTGCAYGIHCNFKHIPSNRGIDLLLDSNGKCI
ncbi:uncharacterized protein LOC144113010 isoform X2 [Amblyomma americanum]